ncbi:MAG: hypothetical protein RR521_11460 [Clostridia bacterium]
MKKRLFSCTALILLLLSVLNASLAETQSSVLTYLYGKESMPDDALKANVQEIHSMQSGTDVTVVVNDCICDGKILNIGFSISTTVPMFIVLEDVTVDGISVECLSSSLEGQWVGNDINTANPDFANIHGFTGLLAESTKKGTVFVNLKVSFLVPLLKLHPMNTYQDNDIDVWKEIDSSIDVGETPVDQDEPFPVLIGSGFFGDGFDTDSPVQYPLHSVDAYIQYANMQIADSFDFTFNIEVK